MAAHFPGDSQSSWDPEQRLRNHEANKEEVEDDDDDGPLDPESIMNEFNQIRKRFNAHDRLRFSAASVPVTEPDRYKDSFVSTSATSGGDDSELYRKAAELVLVLF